MINEQNKRYLALYRQDVEIVMKTKHTVHIFMFGVIDNNGNVMAFMLVHSVRINPEAYIVQLEEILLSWIERMSTVRYYVWKQAYVPCHTSKRTPPCLFENFCNYIILYIFCFTSQIAVPLIMCGAQLNDRPAKILSTPKINWRQRLRQHLQIKTRKSLKRLDVDSKLSEGCGWSWWQFF